MTDIRIIEQQEIDDCFKCPYFSEKTDAFRTIPICRVENKQISWSLLETGFCVNCPLPKKEEIKNRTCRTCKHVRGEERLSKGVEHRNVFFCSYFNLTLERNNLNDINEKFINDTNKNCWEKKSE